jgi:hypothetical protein
MLPSYYYISGIKNYSEDMSLPTLICRCCDEDDIFDIHNLLSTLNVTYWSTEKIESELSCSNEAQWYCVEPGEEDVKIGVFRLTIDKAKPDELVGTLTDIFIAEDVQSSDNLHAFTIKYIVNHVMGICRELHINIFHVEVFEDEHELIEVVEAEKFQEIAGYLSDHRSLMKFRYSKKLRSEADGHQRLLDVIDDSSVEMGVTDEFEGVFDLNELTLDPIDEVSSDGKGENMMQLIESLFSALHKEKELS